MGGERSTVTTDVSALRRLTTEIFAAAGCSPAEASIVADDLVTADQMGLHSHGTLRIKEYLAALGQGRLRSGGDCAVVAERGAAILVDGGAGFGQVVGRFAVDVGIERARSHGTSCVVTRNSFHIGRMGALIERVVASEMICLAAIAVDLPGQVAPWGSTEGTLSTNPIGYGDGRVVADFATSAMAGGAIALALRDGRSLPEGIIVTSDGDPTTDPAELFADPPGAILPIGGPVGYKGFALNLLPELVAAGLAGYGPNDPTRSNNCLFLVVVDPSAFLPVARFRQLASESARLVTGARPRSGCEVMLPGEREDRASQENRERVDLSAAAVDDLRQAAKRLGVNVSL